MLIAALPVISSAGCSSVPGLSEICGPVGNLGASILGAGAQDVLGVVAGAVAQGASWLLGQIGTVIASTTTVDLGASWFKSHYEVMVALAAVVVLPLLLASVVQSVVHQDVSSLLRTALVHLPLALLLGAIAIQLVQLALAATDAMSRAVSATSSSDIGSALSNLAAGLANQTTGGNPGAPVFVALLGALLVSFGALLLWVELLIRASAVYLTTLFFPLALATVVWPAISQWCRRLVETVAALVLSKFVIVVTLSLAVGAFGSSDRSIASEMGGGALLLLAGFAPFTLLKLVPMVESSAVQYLEGAHHRLGQSALAGPRSAVAFALGHRPAEPLAQVAPGTGIGFLPEVAGPGSAAQDWSDYPGSGAGPADMGVPMWHGVPDELRLRSIERESETEPDFLETPPIWGSPVVSSLSPTRVPRGGEHRIDQDELGPVLRWIPPEPVARSRVGHDG